MGRSPANLVDELLKAAESDEREEGFAYILLRQSAREIEMLRADLQRAEAEKEHARQVNKADLEVLQGRNDRLTRDLAEAREALKESEALQGCWHCFNADSGDPEQHEHGTGLHWHHYIDPGDGLPSPCKNSDLLNRVTDALAKSMNEENDRHIARIIELEAKLATAEAALKAAERDKADMNAIIQREIRTVEQQEIAIITARLAKAQEALRDSEYYAQHQDRCPFQETDCVCGYEAWWDRKEAALAALQSPIVEGK